MEKVCHQNLLRRSRVYFLVVDGVHDFAAAAAGAAKSLQLCPTLCNPIDDSPPGSPIPGIASIWENHGMKSIPRTNFTYLNKPCQTWSIRHIA